MRSIAAIVDYQPHLTILAIDEELEVGQVCEGEAFDHQDQLHRIAFCVVRLATRDEYLAQCRDWNSEPTLCNYHYAVHMD